MIVPSTHIQNKPKIYFTHGLLPKYVDEAQLPRKDKPWGTMFQQRWASSVELVLDESLYDKISEQLLLNLGKTAWCCVTLPLVAILQGEFFDTYVKRGNVSMLSNGRVGLDPIYTLYDGVLRLELPKDLYERAGLVGHAIPDGGRKHVKTRFAVEFDLRQPSMMRGKKGFERLVWACKNVLSEAITWLFHDHWPPQTLESGVNPLQAYQSDRKDILPAITRLNGISVPDMRSWAEDPERTTDDAGDLLDWLGMVSLESPRISCSDSIDPFLARYEVPERERASSGNLVIVRWSGFLQAEWIRQLLLQCMTMTKTKPAAWYAINVRTIFKDAHEYRDGYTILRTRSKELESSLNAIIRPEFLMWEMASSIIG